MSTCVVQVTNVTYEVIECIPRRVIVAGVTAENTGPEPTQWLTLADLVDVLGESLSRVRQLIAENHLIASRRNGGGPQVPAIFLVDGRPLPSLRGTVIVLHDAGFSDDEAIDWLLAPDESIGDTPIAALRAGRKSEVRRVARILA